MIGALALSEQAAKLEAAANAGDGNTIRYEHDSMMQRYEEVVNAIKSLGSESEPDSGDDDEIMEFLPDPD